MVVENEADTVRVTPYNPVSSGLFCHMLLFIIVQKLISFNG